MPAYHLVWLTLEIFVSVISGQEDVQTTACVGRCDFGYRMDCPRGHRVAPRDLTYYAKQTTAQCPDSDNPSLMCQASEQCCSYYGGDCSLPFSYQKAFQVFNNCSGYQNCGWFRAESVQIGSRCSYRDKTNYIAASYSCIKEETFIDICSEASRRGKSVSLLYNGSRYANATGDPRVCSCAISTSDCDSPGRLKFRAVDVRLHSHNDINHCNRHSRVTLTDTKTSEGYRCQNNYFQKGFYDLFYSASPYARVSLYNQPGVYPSQVWLEVSATVRNIDVIVTCGSNQPENLVFCGPPSLLTTPAFEQKTTTKTPGDIFGPSGNEGEVPSGGENEPRDKEDATLNKKGFAWPDLGLIVGAVAGLLVIILIIVIIIICIKHRREKLRKKPPMLPHPVPLSTPSSVIPSSFPSSDTEERYTEEQFGDDKYGNYYESMAQPNGSMDNKSPFTPGKAMGSFFPNDRPRVPPPAPPSIPATPPVGKSQAIQIRKSPENKLDANPYHTPWDGSVFQAPSNRVKKNDLAYATSDEIQVLIQRMENERGHVAEGLNIAKPIPQKGYIYIDDYQKGQGESSKATNTDLYVYQSDSDDSESESENKQVNGDQSDEASNRPSQGEQGVSEGTPRSNDNFCGSEDTGYRSVGSPEHVLVSEDDYLVPGSVKSNSSKGTSSSTVKVSERGSVIYNSSYGEPYDARRSEAGSNSYGDPYDAVQKKETVDVKTKF
ncbi:uncharacterized protein LOC133199595 isoform X1 [Saccostrea echinata]|uniref:uncharacterized protein LOC133199595 isoform X1 n=1 Tax=Saccostrea echinata TaxID=191078 RepID=UPI002A81F004|nr:uncharacterized protein LOC133199595 isoform X1 [Saccostrea echinata]